MRNRDLAAKHVRLAGGPAAHPDRESAARPGERKHRGHFSGAARLAWVIGRPVWSQSGHRRSQRIDIESLDVAKKLQFANRQGGLLGLALSTPAHRFSTTASRCFRSPEPGLLDDRKGRYRS